MPSYQKLALNCNSRWRYKGSKFDSMPYKPFKICSGSFKFGTSSKIREIYMGQYQTFILYISAGNYNKEVIFGKDPFLRTLYLKMAPNPIISQIYFL